MSDLRDRVPGQALIEELLRQWDKGTIRVVPGTEELVIGDDAISWFDGVKGERHVASLLSGLGQEWTVLHSVPAGSGRADVDHVVIGPAGVFTVNTKNSSGRRIWAAGFGLRIDNIPNNGYIQGALREHSHAERVLSTAAGFAVPLTTLITFVDPSGMSVTARPGDGVADIRVIPDSRLLATISGRRVMSDEQIAKLIAAAVRPETWHTRPAPSTTGAKIAREFDALDEAVGWHIARRGQAPAVTAAARPVHATARAAAPAAPGHTSMPAPVSTRARSPRLPRSYSPRVRAKPTRSNRRRPRQSPLERFVRAVAPFGVLFAAWIYFTQLYGR